MNNNIFSSVESRLESIKSPGMIKDFIKIIKKPMILNFLIMAYLFFLAMILFAFLVVVAEK